MFKLRDYRAIVLALTLFCGSLPGAVGAPATRPANADPMEQILPDVNFDDVPLDDVIDFLQEIVPDFKTMVVREHGVPDKFPSVKFKLKHVTMGQLWELLQLAHPELEVQPVQGKPTPIYLIRVRAPAAESLPAATVVRVYRLAPLVAPNAAKGNGAANPTLDSVLSLIKATLAQAPGHADAVIQVHTETQTLIFKGSPEQKAALEEALASLEPEASPQRSRIADLEQKAAAMTERTTREAEEAAARAEELQNRLAELKARLADQEKAELDHVIEAEKLKARLEEQTEQMKNLKESQKRSAVDSRPASAPAQP